MEQFSNSGDAKDLNDLEIYKFNYNLLDAN